MLAAILYGGTIYAGGIGAVIKSEYVKSKQLELSEQVKAKIQELTGAIMKASME